MKYFYRALKLNPGSAEINNNLGVALFYKGNNAEALAHFKEALKIDPDFMDARNNLRNR